MSFVIDRIRAFKFEMSRRSSSVTQCYRVPLGELWACLNDERWLMSDYIISTLLRDRDINLLCNSNSHETWRRVSPMGNIRVRLARNNRFMSGYGSVHLCDFGRFDRSSSLDGFVQSVRCVLSLICWKYLKVFRRNFPNILYGFHLDLFDWTNFFSLSYKNKLGKNK